MKNPLQTVCTIDHGRFMKLFIHSGERGKVNDTAPAGSLPCISPDINGGEQLRRGKEINGRAACRFYYFVIPLAGLKKVVIIPQKTTAEIKYGA